MTDNGSLGKAVVVASLVLALLFLLNGGLKVAGLTVEQFAVWGYPPWFQYLVGVAEVLAGAGFMWRRARFAAAVIVIPIMLGAIYTLVRAGTPLQAAIPTVALLLALFVAKKSR